MKIFYFFLSVALIVVALTFSENIFAQNVGIGIAAPGQKLHIGGSANTVRIDGISTGGTHVLATAAATDLLVYTNTSGDLKAMPNGIPGAIMTIDAAGIPKWTTPAAAPVTNWTILGNTGTSAAINFIGTTDAVDWVIKTFNTERMRFYSTGGAMMGNVPSGGNALQIDMTAGVNAGSTGLIINNFVANANARNGISLNLNNLQNSNGISISNVGATGMNGIDINSSANGNGTGIRIGGTTTLGTGMWIRGGTGIIYNALNAGSGTGMTIGGTTAPLNGIDAITSGVGFGGIFQSNSNGFGVGGYSFSAAYVRPAAIPTVGVRAYAGTNNNTANDVSYGVYSLSERGTTGGAAGIATSTNYGVYSSAIGNGTTHNGMNIGVYGTASLAGNGTRGAIGGMFNAISGANFLSLAATGGGNVYLGSIDADRPSNFTAAPITVGAGNLNTTYIYNTRISGSLIFPQATGVANTISISAPAAVTTYSMTLPSVQGGVNSVLTNNGAGVLSWSSPNGLAWTILGNSGTNPAVNFIGTTDAVDWVIRTTNVERMRVSATGFVGINTAPLATRQLLVATATAANYAIAGNNTAAAGTSTGVGVFGSTIQGAAAGTIGGAGTYGLNTSATGYGVVGIGNNIGAVTFTTLGAGGLFAGSNYGVYGSTNLAPAAGQFAIGVRGISTGVPSGTGFTVGVYGSVSSASGSTYGTYGISSSPNGYGALGINTNVTGTGVVGLGNNAAWIFTLVAGSGGSFTGDVFGGAGYATSNAAVGQGLYGVYNPTIAATGLPGNGVAGGVGVWGYNARPLALGVGNYGTLGTYNVAGYGAGVVGIGFLGVYPATTPFDMGVYGSSIDQGVVGVSGALPAIYPISTGSFGSTNTFLGWGVVGSTSDASGQAMYAFNTAAAGAGVGDGIMGQTAQTQGFSVWGLNTNAVGTGVVGAGNNSVSNFLGTGSGGAFTGNDGSYNRGTGASGNGVIGSGNNIAPFVPAGGSGGSFTSSNYGVYGYGTLGSSRGVYGINGAAAGTTNNGHGVYGTTSQGSNAGNYGGFGVMGLNLNGTGTGVVGIGNNLATINYLTGGSGGSFNSTNVGVYGSTGTATGTGGYFNNYTASGASTGSGVLAVTNQSLGYGVNGQNTHAAGFAIRGVNTAASGINVGTGVYGLTAQSLGAGVWGEDTHADGTGIIGVSTAASGAGVGWGAYLATNQSNGFGAFIENTNGVSSATDFGAALWAINSGAGGSGYGNGALGTTDQENGFGIWGVNFSNTSAAVGGTGVIGAGNNETSFYLPQGSGGAFTGRTIGVYGRVSTDSLADGSAGGYFYANANAYAYVGTRSGGTDYKILGAGLVSTIVPDQNNVMHIMGAPEAPEALFQDYGTGRLVNGHAHIDLDPILSNNIQVDEKHLMKVFIQLEGDCNGVFVTNKSGNGFDVTELNGGNSNVPFSWQIVANRADVKDANGNVISRYADNRFELAPVNPNALSKFAGSGNTYFNIPSKKNIFSEGVPENNLIGTVEVNTSPISIPDQFDSKSVVAEVRTSKNVSQLVEKSDPSKKPQIGTEQNNFQIQKVEDLKNLPDESSDRK